jgi:hypothetical protein
MAVRKTDTIPYPGAGFESKCHVRGKRRDRKNI